MTAITIAARLLREAAAELKNAHTLGGDWGNEHEALDAYNEHMATATTLEHMARQCLAQIEEPAAPAAVAPQGVVAWMHPGTLDVILDERKVAWMDCYGAGGKAKAERYTVPLGHIGQPGAVIDAASDLIALRDEYAQKTQNAMPGNEYWGTRFDAKYQALAAALAAAPALQAPAASTRGGEHYDERAAYVEFLTGKFPQTYSKEDAEHWWDHGHVSALTWKADRADAAAPAAPAVDAAAPIDGCTDPYNCARCKTHSAHRGDMHHAGISQPRSAAQAAAKGAGEQ